jgi:hypothetical protein
MFEKHRARVRHDQLIYLAGRLVSGALREETAASPRDLRALAFGEYQLDIDEEEAARYLDAARVQHGFRLPEDMATA